MKKRIICKKCGKEIKYVLKKGYEYIPFSLVQPFCDLIETFHKCDPKDITEYQSKIK